MAGLTGKGLEAGHDSRSQPEVGLSLGTGSAEAAVNPSQASEWLDPREFLQPQVPHFGRPQRLSRTNSLRPSWPCIQNPFSTETDKETWRLHSASSNPTPQTGKAGGHTVSWILGISWKCWMKFSGLLLCLGIPLPGFSLKESMV